MLDHNALGIAPHRSPRGPIPTLYGGLNLRSRLEADCAYLLDLLRLGWSYEPFSFLLPDGTHYAPDFWVASRSLWVEPRGYRDPHGDAQIAGFAARVHNGLPTPEIETAGGGISGDIGATDYLVIGPEDAVLHEYEGRFGIEEGPAYLLRCGKCNGYSFIAQGGDEGCKGACVPCGGSYGPNAKWRLGIVRGLITIDGIPFREWRRECMPQSPLSNTNSF